MHNHRNQTQQISELRAELEKLNAIKAGTEQKQPPVFQSMLASLRKAQKILEFQASLNPNEDVKMQN